MCAKFGAQLQSHTSRLSGAESLLGKACRRGSSTRPGPNAPTFQNAGVTIWLKRGLQAAIKKTFDPPTPVRCINILSMRPSLTTICALDICGREVHLSVRHEGADVWHWKVLIDDGMILEQGMMNSRLAAQVAAQRAFEFRLQRAGVCPRGFNGYRWKDLVG